LTVRAAIDLHCHILPGLDDGPAEQADSLAMADQAEADGIELVCATPHIRHDHDVRIGELGDRIDELNAALTKAGSRVRITSGGEVAETAAERLDDAELRAVSLGGGESWILLEPRPGPLSDSLAHVVGHLAERGYRSLIAHPERHPSPAMIERLSELTARGALIQGTAAYLEGENAPLLYLATHGVLHVLGSDSHSSRAGRPLRISAALRRLHEVEPLAPHVEWIARDAPEAIIHGEPVEPPFAPTPP
jgi:protein-tyrosine phosphatase